MMSYTNIWANQGLERRRERMRKIVNFNKDDSKQKNDAIRVHKYCIEGSKSPVLPNFMASSLSTGPNCLQPCFWGWHKLQVFIWDRHHSLLKAQTIFILIHKYELGLKLSSVHQVYYKILIVLFNFPLQHEQYTMKFVRQYFLARLWKNEV